MKDTDIALDIIFIDEDMSVKSVNKGVPYSEELISASNVQYVLEVNQGSGILPGMEVEFSDVVEDEIKLNTMYIMGSDGNPQMELSGGERIFSRTNTKVLVNMAKRAYKTQKASDFKRLGKKVFEYLYIQDTNDPEYVEKKED